MFEWNSIDKTCNAYTTAQAHRGPSPVTNWSHCYFSLDLFTNMNKVVSRQAVRYWKYEWTSPYGVPLRPMLLLVAFSVLIRIHKKRRIHDSLRQKRFWLHMASEMYMKLPGSRLWAAQGTKPIHKLPILSPASQKLEIIAMKIAGLLLTRASEIIPTPCY